jgi:uncharacterized protein
MKCPRCTGELVASVKHGIEVDVCGGCRGMWLDRGELEKVAARSTSRNHDHDDDDHAERFGRRGDDDDDDGPGGRRRGSFWSRLLDFD